MTMKHLHYLFLLCLHNVSFQSQVLAEADSVPILHLSDKMPDSIHIHTFVGMYLDKTKALSLQVIQNQSFKPFNPRPIEPGEHWQHYHFWYHFTVENQRMDTLKMSFNFGRFDSMVIYTLRQGKVADSVTVGRLVRQHPQKGKTFYPSNRTALLTFPAGERTDIYVRCTASSAPLSKSAFLFRPESEASYFIRTLLPIYVWHFVFMGILCFVMLQALGHYIQQRHKAFLFYAGYIFEKLLFFWLSFESYDQFSHTIPTFLLDYTYYVPLAVGWVLLYIPFLVSFFDTKQKMPKVHRYLKHSFWIGVCFLLFEQILVRYDKDLAWQVTYWVKFFFTIAGAALIVSLLKKRHENPLVKYILIGTGFYTAGSIGVRLSVETSEFWDDTLLYSQLGILGELVFFSMGLSRKSYLDAVGKKQYAIENQRLIFDKERETTRLRTQIAQDIHDEVGAGLTKIALASELATRLPNITEEGFRHRLTKLSTDTRSLAIQMREIVFAINPDYDRFGEMQAYFRETARDFWADTDKTIHFDFEKPKDNPIVSPNVKRQLLLIFKEAQNNAAKHAQATAIHLTFKMVEQNHFLLQIQDNGLGFTPLSIHALSNGLAGIKRRADSIAAQLCIESSPESGTRIRIEGHI